MGFSDEYAAIRQSAAWTRSSHMVCCRICGEGAYDLLERVCPAELYLRDGQVLHTLFLDERASFLADIYVCRDDEDFLLLSETAPGVDPVAYLQDALIDGDEVEIQDLSATHTVLSLNGPYAWEVLAELLGPDVISLPYMSFFVDDGLVCVRAGKTGEFGYDLILPRGESAEWEGKLRNLSDRFDLREADLAVLDQCALENWFFNIRREGGCGVTPLELQLQWRISAKRSFVGSAAYSSWKTSGPQARVVTVTANQPLAIGVPVSLGGREIGSIINAGQSPLLGDWIGLALVEIGLSHPGIPGLTANVAGHRTDLSAVSPPVLNNRSIFVSPQVHSYATRSEFEFPPLEKEQR